MDKFQTKTYYYNLPIELIAQSPVEPRDSSKLMVYDKATNKVEHKIFRDIIDYLQAGDVLVINNTKVIPARLIGTKEITNAKIEVLLLKRTDLDTYEALIKPGKRVKIGTKVYFSEDFCCEIVDEQTEINGKIVKFYYKGTLEENLDKYGLMPLPHYIKKKLEDKNRYQTVYSKISGSSAAPTAGLHFTVDLLERIKQKGIIICEVLLQVGLGTFRPVGEGNILDHKMHSEQIVISKQTADIINKAKNEKRRIIAVGTTSVRTLESSVNESGELVECNKETDIFIYPGYKFKIVDALITNFHLPESTLIMLVSSFIGIDKTLELYNLAVKEKYRFFSFGDAMFLQ